MNLCRPIMLALEAPMASEPTAPRPKKHHGKLCWFVHWYDDSGERRDKWFGRCDELTERQAITAYKLWKAKWHREDRIRNPKATAQTYLADDLAVDYLAHARKTFTKHGRITSHVWNVAYSMQAILDDFKGRTLASIEAPDVVALRDAMIRRKDDAGEKTAKTVNDRLSIIKAAFRWARERGLVPREVAYDVSLVTPLREGRSAAKPSVVVKPVAEHWMAVVRDLCAAPIKAMIELQWLTGMRPGEARLLRMSDIDRAGDVWLYYPSEHKLEHKKKQRIIPIGPRAQAIINSFANRPPTDFLFSPAEAYAELLARKRAARKPQKFPSWVRTPSHNPVFGRGNVYSTGSYRKAVHYACDKADRMARKANPDAEGRIVPLWNPNQLRHAAATEMNRHFPLEAVSINLGHSDLRTTRIYAHPDVSQAMDIARKCG